MRWSINFINIVSIQISYFESINNIIQYKDHVYFIVHRYTVIYCASNSLFFLNYILLLFTAYCVYIYTYIIDVIVDNWECPRFYSRNLFFSHRNGFWVGFFLRYYFPTDTNWLSYDQSCIRRLGKWGFLDATEVYSVGLTETT